jgi:hypothetical protein
MEETNINNPLLTKRNIITLLVVLIILLIIPLGVKLVQQQQQLRSKAASQASITFSGPNVSSDKTTTTSPEVQVELRAPWPPQPVTP